MGRMTLHIQQASLQFSDRLAYRVSDLDTILSRGADVVGFTEAARVHPELAAACRRHGYRPVLPKLGDGALAVHRDHKLHDHGVVKVNPGRPGLARNGGHGPRGITWAAVGIGSELVTFCEAHWLTHRSDPSGRQRREMSKAMADTVAEHARGSRLAFWLGDTNTDDGPEDRPGGVQGELTRGHLTSVWDELDSYPPTHGRNTIDVVGSYDPDGRVTAVRAKVWAQLHADHRQVSAYYSVRHFRE